METSQGRIKSRDSRTIDLLRTGQAIAASLIPAFWIWLYRPVFGYLATLFSREEFRTNQIVLAGVLALLVLRFHSDYRRQATAGQRLPDSFEPGEPAGGTRLPAGAGESSALVSSLSLSLKLFGRVLLPGPRLYFPALGLALGCSVLFLIAERTLNINTLSATLFGLASYGLLGLWLGPRRWREGLPAALLLIGVLPFGEHLDTFIGYPLRILTATLVRDGLAAAGVGSVGVDTILVFENGISQIDLPCSGVKSLWTGALFLVAATWIERRPLNRRWLLAALGLAGLLFLANLSRVGVLVAVGQVAGWQLAAELLHVPLGMLGFGAACVVAVRLLRGGAAAGGEPGRKPLDQAENLAVKASGEGSGEVPSRPAWLAPLLSLAILGMAMVYTPRPPDRPAQNPQAWTFPSQLSTAPMPLTSGELEWLARGGAESVERRRFDWEGVAGSLILIPSRTWRAHHRPERCFEVYGLTIENWRTERVSAGFPVRFVSLSFASSEKNLSATYWFQSTGRTTDDYAARMWADLAPARDRWVLVTLLFDGVQDPNSPEFQALTAALHAAVQRNLAGGAP